MISHSSIISLESKENFVTFLLLSLLGKISLISETLLIGRESESWQGGSRKRGNEDGGQKYLAMPAGMAISLELVECYETKTRNFAGAIFCRHDSLIGDRSTMHVEMGTRRSFKDSWMLGLMT